MSYGSGSYGEGPYGGVPEPDEFEEKSEQEKNEDYRELFTKLEQLNSEFNEYKSDAKRWRRNSWFWRIGSFITGNVTGLIISVVI